MATWNRDGVPQSSTNTYGQITVSSSNDAILRLESNTDSASDDAIIELVTDADGTPREGRIGVDHSDNTLKLLHGATLSGGTNGISIDSSGKVGIGTATPRCLLEGKIAARTTTYAAGTASTWADITLWNPTDTINTATGIRFGIDELDLDSGTNCGAGIAGVKEHAINESIGLAFITDLDGGAPVERMRIDNTGKVGIGTASPDTKLHIREDVDGYFDALRLENADNASFTARGVDLTFRPYRGYTGGRIRCQRRNTWSDTDFRDSSLDFYTVSNETESLAMRIDYNGYVGIGTDSPTEALHLSSTSEEHPNIVIEKTGSANHDGGNLHFKIKEDSGFVDSGKEMGDIQWMSYDTTTNDTGYHTSAMIRAVSSGTHANNVFGGELQFWTNPDQESTTKRMTIDSAGVVTIPGSLIAKQQVNIPSYMAGDIDTSERFISLQGYATTSSEMNYGHNYVFPCNGVLKHVYFIANDWNPNDSSNTQSWKCYRFRPDGSTNTGAYDTKGNWTVLETVSKANGTLQAQGRGIFVDFTDSTCSFNKGDLMGISLTNSVDVTDSVTDQITMVVSIELDWNNALTGNI